MQLQPPKSLPELVYDAVLNAICEGTLRPGERLTQEAVAGRLNVSRLPVGQALAKLKADGFVVEVGRRGLKVAPLDAQLVTELYGVRSGLDLVSAGRAAQRVTPAAAREGWAILADGRAAAERGELPLLIDADWRFHWLTYETAGNYRLLELMQAQWQHLRRVMINVLTDTENQPQIWDEHAAIWEAICAADAAQAERLAREHVDRASEWLQAALEPQAASQRSTG